jgi:hypothetical protein
MVQTRKQSKIINECVNCKTTISVQWRNSKNGERLCNKCGVYSSRHSNQLPVPVPSPLPKAKSSPLKIIKTRSMKIVKRVRPRKQKSPIRASFE